ncbi:MAG: sulfite exporter TauE/SafE family protein [Candidatus Thiodiazotropha sp.]
MIALVGSFWGVIIALLFDQPIGLIQDNWLITPIAFVAAAFANATAIGGGFLFVPLFVFVYQLNPIAALKLSLATQAFGMTSGALGWSREFIVIKALPIAVVASILGMFFGTYYVPITGSLVKTSFAWVSLFIFGVIVIEIRYGKASNRITLPTTGRLKSVMFFLACFVGGLVTAWTAIGIGEVVALYLLFIYRVRIDSAIGTGVAVLAFNSLVGLFFHIHLGGIPWEYLIFTAPGVIIGGYFGANIGRRLESRGNTVSSLDYPIVKRKISPLKLLFASVILVDCVVMLAQTYVL